MWSNTARPTHCTQRTAHRRPPRAPAAPYGALRPRSCAQRLRVPRPRAPRTRAPCGREPRPRYGVSRRRTRRAAGGRTSRPPINVLHCRCGCVPPFPRLVASLSSPARFSRAPARPAVAATTGCRRAAPPVAVFPDRAPKPVADEPLVSPPPSPGHTPASPGRNFTGTAAAPRPGTTLRKPKSFQGPCCKR
jgi:hypothetical protein